MGHPVSNQIIKGSQSWRCLSAALGLMENRQDIDVSSYSLPLGLFVVNCIDVRLPLGLLGLKTEQFDGSLRFSETFIFVEFLAFALSAPYNSWYVWSTHVYVGKPLKCCCVAQYPHYLDVCKAHTPGITRGT